MCRHCSKGSQVLDCFIIRRDVTSAQDLAAKRKQAERVDRWGGSRLPPPHLNLQDRQVQGHWQGWKGKEREKRVR